jgi:hypothetical protein
MDICPTCGAHQAPVLNLRGTRTPRIYNYLQQYSRATTDQLVDAAYGDDANGGPLTAHKCIHALISRINRQIKPHGLVIKGFKGRGGYYQLTKSEGGVTEVTV